MNGRQKKPTAFTLAEAMVASVVLSLAVVAISAVLNAGHAQGYDAAHIQRGTRLAEEWMEYILSRPYYDPQGVSSPGRELGEVLFADLDNMDDFHGYSQAAGEITDLAGNLLPAEYQLFSRSVSVRYGTETVAEFGDPIPGLTITVTVRDNRGRVFTTERFVAQPMQQEWPG